MERLYFKLGAGVSKFVNEELNIGLDSEKIAEVIDLSNLNYGITQGLNRGVIVQITQSEYLNLLKSSFTSTTKPIIDDSANKISPFVFSKPPLNSLPIPLLSNVFYLLGNSPLPPFDSYPQYIVREFTDHYKVWKPENLDIAIVTNTPSHYWQYFGVWPSGSWVQYREVIEIANPTTDTSLNQVSFTIRGEIYATLDLKSRIEIPGNAIITDLAIFREGTKAYEGTDLSEYQYDSPSKVITWNTEVSEIERVSYSITYKLS